MIYASKAYFGQAMLRLAREEGLSVDVASGGELFAALQAGFPPERIHMHGNNKDAREIGEALDAGVGTVIVDNLDEIALLDREAGARGVRQRVLIRVTPGVKPSTHSYISTGQLDSKFGFSIEGGPARRGRRGGAGGPRPEPRGAPLPHRVAAVRPLRLRGRRGDRRRLREGGGRRGPARSWTWAAASASRTPAATTRRRWRTTPRPW